MGNFKMVIMVIFVFLMLTSCGNKDQSGVLKPVLIESQKSLPHSFEQIATESNGGQYIVERVGSIEDLKERWDKFQIESELIDIDMETNDVLFIGLYESSTCPYNIQNIDTDYNRNKLIIKLFVEDENCTADASPRNFILSIDKDKSKGLTTLVIVDGAKEISLHINDV